MDAVLERARRNATDADAKSDIEIQDNAAGQRIVDLIENKTNAPEQYMQDKP